MKFHTSIVQARYASPLGHMIVAATARGVAGIWFDGQRHLPSTSAWPVQADHPVLLQAVQQLDEYFAGKRTAFDLPLNPGGNRATPFPQLTGLFPQPDALARAQGDALGQLGIVRQRQAAIVAIAQAVADKRLQLHGGADVQQTVEALKQLPGIGDWTAQYIAMRALRWPDAFPAGDVALHKALGVLGAANPARAALAASQAWKPWRSYAVIRAWAAMP